MEKIVLLAGKSWQQMMKC